MGVKEVLENIFYNVLPYTKKAMINDLNNYLLAYKLHEPSYLSSSEIEYFIENNRSVRSLKKHTVENVMTNTRNHGINLTYWYYNNGLKIEFIDSKGVNINGGSKTSALSISITDRKMKHIMTEEFKNKVKKYFKKPVYTSLDFDSSSMDYNTEIKVSRRQATKIFIELNKAAEKLQQNINPVEEQIKNPDEKQSLTFSVF